MSSSGSLAQLDERRSFLSKLVSGPQRPVGQITSWLRLLQKASCVKHSVVGLEPEMPVRLPKQFGSGAVPNEPCSTASCRADKRSRHVVHTIFKALSPLENPIDRKGHIMGKRSLYTRVNVNEVDRARACCRGQNPKVVTAWKHGIKCSQRFRARVVPTRNVRLYAETRFQCLSRIPVTGFG